MSSDSITVKRAGRPARGALFLLLAIRAALTLVAVGILWITLFVLFLPFLLLSELLGWPRKSQGAEREAAPLRTLRSPDQVQLIFDRRKDISKLFGCNTRNVPYRWRIFSDRLEEIKQKPSELRALDFGAGSLRDSYELTRQGFQVFSMDLDPQVMQQYCESYDWTLLPSTPRMFTDSIDDLAEVVGLDYFHLAISFDVIEHLENPQDYLQQLRPLLRDDGYLFTIVPTRRSIYERHFKRSLKKAREKGLPLTPGVPHLQFRSPEEWDEFIEKNGFQIVAHEMAIGTLVNDVWNGALALPVYLYVTPVLQVLLPKLGATVDATLIERAATPAWLMRRIDVLDNLFKKQLHGQFGWNLIVARKRTRTGSGPAEG
jgi:SAM-dependent methyltransferase